MMICPKSFPILLHEFSVFHFPTPGCIFNFLFPQYLVATSYLQDFPENAAVKDYKYVLELQCH